MSKEYASKCCGDCYFLVWLNQRKGKGFCDKGGGIIHIKDWACSDFKPCEVDEKEEK